MTSDILLRASIPLTGCGNAVVSGCVKRSGIELHAALRQIGAEAWTMNDMKTAKFAIGQVVRHRLFPFRGVIFDVDPEFNNTEEWYEAIPAEVRPRKDQPFYHLLAENAETEYIAYVSEQNLLEDESGEPVRHPQLREMFDRDARRQLRAEGPRAALSRRTLRRPDRKSGAMPRFFRSDRAGRSVGRLWPCPALP